MNASNPVKLNLGCGLQVPQGWVNIDSSMGVRLAKMPVLRGMLSLIPTSSKWLPNKEWSSNVKWMNITRTFPFADNSVDVVYSSHTIEHLTYEEGKFVFKESIRVLKPGGVIRIIVPDFGEIVQTYLEEQKKDPALAAQKFLTDTFYFEIPIPNTFSGLFKFYFKRKNNHYFLYDKAGLQHQLENAGFRNISFKAWGESAIPNISEIDIPERFHRAICIEAVKP